MVYFKNSLSALYAIHETNVESSIHTFQIEPQFTTEYSENRFNLIII